MMVFKSLEWYKKHPEVIVRHHGERWSDLHIHVLLLLFKNGEPLDEMTRMLGRTETSVMAQLARQKMIWYDSSSYNYYLRGPRGSIPSLYNGKNFR